jgi:simple sugar transport system permease protein
MPAPEGRSSREKPPAAIYISIWSFVFIGLVVLLFSLYNQYFFTYGNLTDILRSISIVTFVAIGVTISLMVDGFDLSVGATVSLSTVVTATLMVWYEMPLL